MSVQYDVLAGLDITGLSSVTKAQLLQMINQLAPLPNIGGVIVMSGAAGAHPDVTNNARFIRYIWLDTQTANSVLLKIYQGTYPSDVYADWSTVAIADNSITAAKLANYAVSILNGSGASKIAYRQDAASDVTKANYLLRLDANGQYVEIIAAATVVNGVTLNPAKLDVSTASNLNVLSYDSSLGYAVWKAISVVAAIADNSLAYSKLLTGGAGTEGWLFRLNPTTKIPEVVVNNDLTATSNLFANHSIRLITLDVTAAATNDVIQFDGTNWVRRTPCFLAPTAGGTVIPGADGVQSVAHGLGAAPRNFQMIVVCNDAGGDNGYAQNDRVNADQIWTNTAGTLNPSHSVYADATNIYAAWDFATSYLMIPKAGGARAAIAQAKWNVFFWASL